MSYQTIKDKIADILEALEYTEAEVAFDMGDQSAAGMGNVFIINCLSGERGDESEDLNNQVTDNQKWEIQIAFEKSGQSDIINRDEAHRARDTILADLDDPENWKASIRMLKYTSWELTDEGSYYLLKINLTVTDTYTY